MRLQGTSTYRADRDQSGVTAHHQVYLQISEAIRSGKFQPGDLLPAEVELCSIYGVSRITIRKAMERLVEEGRVVRQRGRGTFVQKSEGTGDVQELLENVEKVMSSTRGRIVSLKPTTVFGKLARLFGKLEEQTLLETVHVRTKGNVPIGLLWSYTPVDFNRFITRKSAMMTPAALLIKQAGYSIGEVDQVITAQIANAAESSELNVPAGFPLLKIERTLYDRDKNALEHLIAYYRSDYYAVHMRLTPQKGGTEHWSIHSFS